MSDTANIRIIETPAYTTAGYPPCTEFYVYHGDKLIRVCPSIGMAREVASSVEAA